MLLSLYNLQLHKRISEAWVDSNEIDKTELLHSSKVAPQLKCETCEREFSISCYELALNNKWCPYCEDRLLLEDSSNSLIERYPYIAKFWSEENDLAADQIACHSRQVSKFVCLNNKNHCWESSPDNMVLRSDGRPECLFCLREQLIEAIAIYFLELDYFNIDNITKPWDDPWLRNNSRKIAIAKAIKTAAYYLGYSNEERVLSGEHNSLLEEILMKKLDYKKKEHIPKYIRQLIFTKDDYTCLACQATEDLSIDHIVPEIEGGGLEESNLQTLCRSCNSSKGTKTINYRSIVIG